MEEHMKSAKQVHLDLMCSLAHKQQDTIKKLNDQLDKSNTSYNGVLVWKIKVRNLVAVTALKFIYSEKATKFCEIFT